MNTSVNPNDSNEIPRSKRPKGLGRGLDALLGEDSSLLSEGVRSQSDVPSALPVTDLQPGKYQPRTHMDEEALNALAASIKEQGLMQPILVRPLSEVSISGAANYEIIAGERRWRAAQIAGLTEVPVLVREVPDEAALAMALIENIQRENLNPLEEAQGLKRLIDEFSFTHERAALAVGRSRSAASNLLRLLNLPKPVQDMLNAGDLDMGHARALLSLEAAQQILIANELVAKQLSVRETEAYVQRVLKEKEATLVRKNEELIPSEQDQKELARLAEALSDFLAMPVSIHVQRNGKGQVNIPFPDASGLSILLEKLGLKIDL